MGMYHGRHLGKYLIAEGLCPPNASNVELHVPANGAVFVRYDAYLDLEGIEKASRALAAMAAQARQEEAARAAKLTAVEDQG